MRAPQEWHREALARAYSRPDLGWKRTAVFGMGFVEGFAEAVVEAVQSTDPDTSQLAVQAAGN